MPTLSVRRRPRVAILATGDELVPPGEPAGPDQIVASNRYRARRAGRRAPAARPLDLGIARDTPEASQRGIARRARRGADVLVTLGGASVGEHDLVQAALDAPGHGARLLARSPCGRASR